MSNNKADYSIREDIKEILHQTGISLDENQINGVLDEVVGYESLLDIIKLYVLYGIEDYCKHNDIKQSLDELENVLYASKRNINLNELL